jgi:hypothetical protein
MYPGRTEVERWAWVDLNHRPRPYQLLSNRIAYKDVVKRAVTPLRCVFTAARIGMIGQEQQES